MCINKNKELLPYYERAKELLSYNPDTGVFTKFIKRSNSEKEVGRVDSRGYSQIGITLNEIQKRLSSHRIAWFVIHGELPEIIDHIDKNPSNNSIKNLRSCTNRENQFNSRKQINNTSGYKGVCWNKKNKKFVAQIRKNGKPVHLGSFDCPKEASKAYEAKAKELHGEFYMEKGK